MFLVMYRRLGSGETNLAALKGTCALPFLIFFKLCINSWRLGIFWLGHFCPVVGVCVQQRAEVSREWAVPDLSQRPCRCLGLSWPWLAWMTVFLCISQTSLSTCCGTRHLQAKHQLSRDQSDSSMGNCKSTLMVQVFWWQFFMRGPGQVSHRAPGSTWDCQRKQWEWPLGLKGPTGMQTGVMSVGLWGGSCVVRGPLWVLRAEGVEALCLLTWRGRAEEPLSRGWRQENDFQDSVSPASSR